MVKSGQAPALTISQWNLWLNWLNEHAGPRVYFVMLLTGALGLRCGEALALKREDLHLEGAIPKVVITGETAGARKSPGDVYVRKQHLLLLRSILKNGVVTKRTRGHKHGKGPRKVINFTAKWMVPETGYIFGSRKKATQGHLHYNGIYAHVRREAPRFAKALKDAGKPAPPEIAKLRPHSGRATLITELMGEGMTTAMSMKYARHAPDSYKVHLKHGRLTLQNVKAACDALQSSKKKTRWSTMTTKELIAAQKAINKELELRLHK